MGGSGESGGGEKDGGRGRSRVVAGDIVRYKEIAGDRAHLVLEGGEV